MSKVPPSSITIEEAVALMVNFDYIPTGFSLLDMTAAFQEEAEVEYHNATLDRLPKVELDALMSRVEACKARHKLAESLLEHIKQELANPDDSLLVLSSEISSMPRLELGSVADWASEKYGIGIPDWSEHDATKIHHADDAKKVLSTDDVANEHRVEDVKNELRPNVAWKDVKIKIYRDYKLGCFLGQEIRKQSHFRDIGLMGKRKNKPNDLGLIFIGLSHGKKYPSGVKPKGGEKTNISKIRYALSKLTGISRTSSNDPDPFYPFNDHDGWKPIFKVDDSRRNADERAKKEALHRSYEDTKRYDNESDPETRDYDDENDKAGRWLKEND